MPLNRKLIKNEPIELKIDKTCVSVLWKLCSGLLLGVTVAYMCTILIVRRYTCGTGTHTGTILYLGIFDNEQNVRRKQKGWDVHAKRCKEMYSSNLCGCIVLAFNVNWWQLVLGLPWYSFYWIRDKKEMGMGSGWLLGRQITFSFSSSSLFS